MKLKEFIEKLERIAREYGNDVKVIMADDIPVAAPVFSKKYPDKKNVVITDEE